MILCALPLWLNAQVKDFHFRDRMKNEEQKHWMKFNRPEETQWGAPQFPKEKPFVKKQFAHSTFRAANGTIQVLDSVIQRNLDGEYVSKEEDKYDNRGNCILSTDYDWDNNTNTWAGSEKYEYQFDENNNILSITTYEWYDGACTAFINQYYYSLLTVNSIPSVNSEQPYLAVFPNPATNYMVVKGVAASVVTVSGLSGDIVYKHTMTGENETINVSSWTNGVYIVTLNTGNNKLVSKIVKK